MLPFKDIGDVKSLVIVGSLGDDLFSLTNLNKLDDLTYGADAGTGGDRLFATDLVVKKNVALDFGPNGAGASFFGNTTSIGGDVTAMYGASGGDVDFNAINTAIKGAVTLTGGAAVDRFFLSGDIASVGKGISFTGVGANDRLGIFSAISATVGKGATGKSIDFDGGAGNDRLEIFGGVINLKGILDFKGVDGDNIVDVRSVALNVGGDLSLTGTTGDDNFQVNPRALAVKGLATIDLGAGVNDFTSETATTVLGSTLTVKTLGGGDNVDVEGRSLTIKKAVDINTGDGGDSVFVGGRTVNFGGAVTLTSGTGSDALEVNALNLKIGDLLTLAGGAGDNNLGVFGALLSLKGGVTITALGGKDQGFLLGDGSVKGDVNVDFGLDGVGGQNFKMGGNSGLAGILSLGKTFTYKSTSAATFADSFTGTDVMVAKAVSITTGDGVSTVALENFSTKDNFTLDTGKGADVVNFERLGTFGSSTIGKIALITLGLAADADIDTINIGVSSALGSNNFVKFLGAVTVDGGGGVDVKNAFELAATNFYGAGAPTLLNFP